MRSLLFLAQRIPYPPDKGDKIRSFSVLKHLARSWRIHLGCFVDDPADGAGAAALAEYCADVRCLPLDRRLATLRSAPALLSGRSLSELFYRDRRMTAWVGRTLAQVRPDAAYLFSSVMGQYLAAGPRPRRVVMDFVDVDSDKWGQYAGTTRWPMSAIYRRESRRLLAFDRGVAARADASVFVSPPEAALFKTLAPESAVTTHAIANGVDHAYFSPDPTPPSPFPPDARPIVFTGAMDYWPNIDAVGWFAAECLPLVRQSVPGASFAIVGNAPAPAVRALAALPGVTVTGRVPDVRPYLAHAAAVAAPLRVARGIQNKVLEGMAMGRPVVTTSRGLEGIDAVPGRDLLVADDAPGVAKALVRVLGEPALAAALGAAGRRRIVEAYSWDDKLACLDRLLAGPAP